MIKRLSLRNFMSYASADIPFLPGVNFVCGPNGSGKSSILIAISLALGLSHTERGRRLSDLIRWGSDRALIRLVLDNSSVNGVRPFPEFDTDEVEIERSLMKSGSYPMKIDGVPSTKEELTALIRKQGINPDNMLIIMQQDMVEEFSLLSPTQKLEMLEEVIEFQSYRKDLLQARDDLGALLEEEQQTRRILEGQSRRVTEWERLYEKYQRKRKLEDELEDLTAEALWARVVDGEKLLQQLESRKGEREQELEHLKKRLEDVDARIKERSLRVEESWAGLETSRKVLLQLVSSQAAGGSRVGMLRHMVEEETAEIERLKHSISRDRAEVESTIKKLDRLKAGDQLGDEVVSLETRLSTLKSEVSTLVAGQKVDELQLELGSANARMRELEGLISATKDRISSPFGRDLEMAGQAVGSIPGLAGEVHGPLFRCIQSDDFSPDVIRSLLGEALLRSFVTTNEADRAKVSEFLRERGLDSQIYMVPDSALVLIEEKALPEEEGVIDWAVNRLRAPKHVQALLHRVLGGVLLAAPGHRLEGLAKSLQTTVVNKDGERAGFAQGLIPQVGGKVQTETQSLEAELDRLTQAYSKLQGEVADLSRELEAARAERDRALDSTLQEVLSLHSRIELVRSKAVPADVVLQRESERVRVRSEALAEYKERVLAERNRRVQQLEKELSAAAKGVSGMEVDVSKADLRYQRAREGLERQLQGYYELQGKRMVLLDQMRSANATLRDIEHRISERREETQRLAGEAEELSPRVPSPRDLLELERQISNIRGSLAELSDVPDDIEGVYRMYLSEFETLRKSLQSVIEKKEEMQAELRKGLERWRGIMAGHLEGINRDFNEILGEIGARGGVSLTDGDVRNVGLDIEVGFSGKELTSISTLSQSGGEKSLSTMSFLLALQRQIKSPFRAVDEYDVHLDPMNKDLVTRLLKSAVRQDGAKQYIAITPSQIPRQDLEGAENVVVVQSVEGRSRVGSLVLEASG